MVCVAVKHVFTVMQPPTGDGYLLLATVSKTWALRSHRQVLKSEPQYTVENERITGT